MFLACSRYVSINSGQLGQLASTVLGEKTNENNDLG